MRRRELDLPDLDAVVAEAERLLHSGYDKAGTWDLSQVCLHVAQPINQTIDGFTMTMPVPLRILMKIIGPFVKRSVYKTRRMRAGLRAPEGTVANPCDEAEAVAELVTAANRLTRHKGPWRKHPLFGKLTAEEWRDFHVIHASHHLSFLIPRA